jgi:predicted metal-dependent HD superfamily phosphohydrolase
MNVMLKDDFLYITASYTADKQLPGKLWDEIAVAHTTPSRYYHNLTHLENLYKELVSIKNEIEDWESIIFAIVYHDFVYDISNADNEAQSAEIAVNRLLEINYPASKTERCKAHILATKAHTTAADNDTNLFTDADLSILGTDWEKYKEYALNIAKEYAQIPMFKLGRKGVILNFLKMPALFKTKYFHDKYEAQARNNIQREIDEMLSA